MSEDVREEERGQRSEARKRRRSLAAEPFEDLDRHARSQDEQSSGTKDSTVAAAKRAAGAAAAAAIAGGLAGAAKALFDRRRASGTGDEGDEGSPEPQAAAEPEGDDDGSEAGEREDADQPTARGASDEEDDEETPSAEPEGSTDDDAQPTAVAETADDDDDEPEPDDEPQAAAEDEPGQARGADDSDEDDAPTASAGGPGKRAESDGDQSNGSRPTRGTAPDEIASIVGRARATLEELVGSEPESVSSVKRTDGTWAVTMEVVEVRRIPDSTDVLSSYELVLDEDGGVVQLDRKRRYRRSQVEET